MNINMTTPSGLPFEITAAYGAAALERHRSVPLCRSGDKAHL